MAEWEIRESRWCRESGHVSAPEKISDRVLLEVESGWRQAQNTFWPDETENLVSLLLEAVARNLPSTG
jgi:hypothetical protein